MKAIIFTLALAALCWSASGEEPRVTQVVPAKAYNVVSKELAVVGRIPNSRNLEIKVGAESITSGASTVLKGKAEVSVSANGTVLATYEGPELILIPTETAVEPLSYQRINSTVKDFDAAIAKREAEALVPFFAPGTNVKVEFLTKEGVEARSLTPLEFGQYLKAIFPNAFRITRVDNYNPGSSNDPEERLGTYLQITPDGLKAEGRSNMTFFVVLPEGEIEWNLHRQLTLEPRGNEILITSLEVKVPKALKENWPHLKAPPGSSRRMLRQIQPR